MPPRHRYDERGALRVIAPGQTFDGLMGLAFDQIRTAGEAQAAVLLRMLDIIADLASVSESPSRRRTLLLHAELLGKAAERGIQDERDRGRICAELEMVRRSLQVGGETTP